MKQDKREVSLVLVNLALLLVQFAFAGLAVFARVGTGTMQPVTFATLRAALATPFIWLLSRFVESEVSISQLLDGAYLKIIMLSILGITVNQLCWIHGVKFTSAVNAGIYQPLIPIYTSLICILTRKEKFNLLKFVGICVSIAGALVVLRVENLDLGSSFETTMGNLLLLGNTLGYSLYLIYQKPLLQANPYPFTYTFICFFFGGFFIFFFSLFYLEGYQDLPNAGVMSVVSVLYSGLVGTFFGHSVNIWALKHTNSSLVAIYICLQPALISLLSYIFLDEVITIRDLIGVIIIIIGLLIVIRVNFVESSSPPPSKDGYEAISDTPPNPLLQSIELREITLSSPSSSSSSTKTTSSSSSTTTTYLTLSK
eukprot:TRINITY_DN77_c3_g1_i6.p1 TRINITY_DN77_c3_g1~~TRINITY_DN77_c3_g1_i6.p1  ORF type:complete len:391 (+),score=101.85 TRINITY_DN77_c3_g1_i6:67-1173(+)